MQVFFSPALLPKTQEKGWNSQEGKVEEARGFEKFRL